jgi:hypothetical protein
MMKRLLLATLVATAGSASLAASTLAPTLSAPTELQLAQYDSYRLAVKNNSNVGATGVMLRLPLPAGALVPAVPPGCTFIASTVTELRCSPGNVPARATRSYNVVIKAPIQQTLGFSHRISATATGMTAALSNAVVTDYRHFDIVVVGSPTTLWEIRSCAGGAMPVAYAICPPTSEVVGDAHLLADGSLEDLYSGVPGRWLQPSQHTLRWEGDEVPGWQDAFVTNMEAINSKCFRGQGATQPAPGSSNPVWHTASKICLK